MKASLASFVERIGYEDVGLLSRDFEPAAALKRSQGGPRALRFSVRDSELQAVGNVADTRSKVMTALEVSNLRDAYRKLLSALSSPQRLVEASPPPLREASRGLLPHERGLRGLLHGDMQRKRSQGHGP